MNAFCDTVWVGEQGRNECIHILARYNDFLQQDQYAIDNGNFLEAFFLVSLVFTGVLPVAVLVAQHANRWLETSVIPFILNHRYHTRTFNEPYQFKYLSGLMMYDSSEFRDGEADSETTYPAREYAHTYVCDCTPDGMVYMRFNPEKEAFVYYSTRTIPYRYLNALARKYVIQTNNPICFVRPYEAEEEEPKSDNTAKSDTNNESEEHKEQSDEEDDDEAEPQEVSVFIKAKPIMGGSRAMGNSSNSGKDGSQTITKNIPANHFIRLGSMCDMNLGQHQRIEIKAKPLTFSDFKSMFMSGMTGYSKHG